MKTAVGLLIALLLATPCLGAELYIDLRTNFDAPSDFRYVRAELLDREDGRRQWVVLRSFVGGDFLSGERVAEWEHVDTRHNYLLLLELLDQNMRTVRGRIWYLRMPGGDFATTMLITRP